MPCSNEKCHGRFLCSVETTESIEPEKCEQYKIIAGWWWQLRNGLRDKPGESEIPFADEEDFAPEDFDDG